MIEYADKASRGVNLTFWTSSRAAKELTWSSDEAFEEGALVTKNKARPLQAHTRALIQAAKYAVRDVYDAIVELVTNADDRYQVLRTSGVIEIEVERRRGKMPSILRVRDFADGMNTDTMDKKLSWLGGRDSGLEKGELVRGTHSRGAKDVAALGRVRFESIASDGRFHSCEITPFFEFKLDDSQEATPELRERIGISEGRGTLVTIELDDTQSVPQHDHLKDQIQRLVSLRGILSDENRTIVLRDLPRKRKETLKAPRLDGMERVKETLPIPGYPDVTAKLIICRSKHPFEREPQRFRLGGILVLSKHAIHEATLFDAGLESDPHAMWFYGRLRCPYIDELCIQFDDRFETQQPPEEFNPTYPLDPSRRAGLTREHPFVKALFAEALKRLRPLVEEERQRQEHERASIESVATRRRLNALEKAALDFIQDFSEEEEPARDPEGKHLGPGFFERGFALSPPFIQLVVGHSALFWLTVRQETYPELEVGSAVQIECLSREVVADKHFCALEPHPTREGVLRATWRVTALKPSAATGILARVGPISAEAMVEVFSSEADKYRDVTQLSFGKKKYRLRTDQKQKRIRILAPLRLAPRGTPIEVTVDSRHFAIGGQQLLKPSQELQVAICDLTVRSDGKEATGTLTAKLADIEAAASIASVMPPGGGLSIKLEDIDLGNQRSRWRQNENVLEIAARHPSLQRYLGDKEHKFPGQDSKHFKLLLAEVVAEAVCARVVGRNVQARPEEYAEADWDSYYARYTKHMTHFLPIAHKLMSPEP
ncbi:MAG: hypothetical protein V2A58_08820 [Planctomycetota bacterium]